MNAKSPALRPDPAGTAILATLNNGHRFRQAPAQADVPITSRAKKYSVCPSLSVSTPFADNLMVGSSSASDTLAFTTGHLGTSPVRPTLTPFVSPGFASSPK